MRIFVYEFVSGGGWYSANPAGLPDPGLLAEGQAMLAALVADCLALPGASAVTLVDSRISTQLLPECHSIVVDSSSAERAAFWKEAARADWTIVIAPETQGWLADRSHWVAAAGGRLLGSPTDVIELAGNKHRTALHLAASGLPAPPGFLLPEHPHQLPDIDWPAVIKPVDGAGSQGVRLVRSATDLMAAAGTGWRIERYCPGLPVSVVCLCGRDRRLILPAAEQWLSQDGSMRYLGGQIPLAEKLDLRARALAERVFRALPTAFGYLGVDLVLGREEAGADDYVIEINPRWTTSYVGLRALAKGNIVGALIAMAEGEPAALSFGRQQVQFAADGNLRSSNFRRATVR